MWQIQLLDFFGEVRKITELADYIGMIWYAGYLPAIARPAGKRICRSTPLRVKRKVKGCDYKCCILGSGILFVQVLLYLLYSFSLMLNLLIPGVNVARCPFLS